MKIKSVTLDKHLSAFGATSTLKVGVLNIQSVEENVYGLEVVRYDAARSEKRTFLVPWQSVKYVELLEDSAPKKKK